MNVPEKVLVPPALLSASVPLIIVLPAAVTFRFDIVSVEPLFTVRFPTETATLAVTAWAIITWSPAAGKPAGLQVIVLQLPALAEVFVTCAEAFQPVSIISINSVNLKDADKLPKMDLVEFVFIVLSFNKMFWAESEVAPVRLCFFRI